jgi:hypothetical protein
MRMTLATMTTLCLLGCDARQGPLLAQRAPRDAGVTVADAGHTLPLDAGHGPPLRAAVRADMTLQYQITGTLDTKVAADLFVTDLFDTSAAQISTLHAAGRVVVGYVSVGTLEPWRDDAANFPRAAVGQALVGYPDESWLDIRSSDVRAAMRARFDRALAKGFDGVYASSLGVYRAGSGFPLSQADELEYAETLADAAHARGLNIGLSSDFDLAGQLVPAFDWALGFGCVASMTCAQLLPLQAAGTPVFDLEIETDHASDCLRAADAGVPVTLKHRGYDAYRSTCP